MAHTNLSRIYDTCNHLYIKWSLIKTIISEPWSITFTLTSKAQNYHSNVRQIKKIKMCLKSEFYLLKFNHRFKNFKKKTKILCLSSDDSNASSFFHWFRRAHDFGGERIKVSFSLTNLFFTKNSFYCSREGYLVAQNESIRTVSNIFSVCMK